MMATMAAKAANDILYPGTVQFATVGAGSTTRLYCYTVYMLYIYIYSTELHDDDLIHTYRTPVQGTAGPGRHFPEAED
jgi:hypothetical protein